MWLLLFIWVIICFTILCICHCWTTQKRKWRIEAENGGDGHRKMRAKGEINLEQGIAIRREMQRHRENAMPQNVTPSQKNPPRISLPMEWTAGGNCQDPGGQRGHRHRHNEQRGQSAETAIEPISLETHPAPFPATALAVHRPVFLHRPTCPIDRQIGQGPFRFTIQGATNNDADEDEDDDDAQQPGTSSSAAKTVGGIGGLSNKAMMAFFAQLLSNLGVKLSNGEVNLFVQHDDNVVWVHLGKNAVQGRYAIHAHSMDDIVTGLLEKFAELFISEGLLPSELEQMPREIVDPIQHGHVLKAKSSCTICLAPIQIGEQMTELGCHHFYHSECIHAWLLNRNTCPTCRAVVFYDDPNKMIKKIAGVFF